MKYKYNKSCKRIRNPKILILDESVLVNKNEKEL